ncbi:MULTISPECIES: hypothetical protein [unclassified Enterococcus]|uniref:hypothetical protein n=1 Tax=unclassified Enterococcus TaxID=2608891 RepID=UPI001556BCD4|nr:MULTISPECIES: hypothetical protein [unclassified Enterococcus]MBS7578199.1 hypothetical protein [Enterococcus sp. MMGLQ5-2]MBS7585425.1 hypothetical protein [Enterococcus sp. MMGLQ5-1]NPD13282.1 hypothetical protein [Enterococcus sp. MMGLQ5-1]NPD38030.1 hypothetical protein [Enterococcus sp. MMGLQ5-2]
MKGILIDSHLNDELILQKVAEKIILDPVDEIVVLPSQIHRLKNLLEGLVINLGVFIDYPLGAGTTEKIIFEILDARKNGASCYYISIPLGLMQQEAIEKLQNRIIQINSIVNAMENIYFLLDMSQLKETEKLSLTKLIKQIHLDRLAIISTDTTQISHDLELLRFDNQDLVEIKQFVRNSQEIDDEAKENYYMRLASKGGDA